MTLPRQFALVAIGTVVVSALGSACYEAGAEDPKRDGWPETPIISTGTRFQRQGFTIPCFSYTDQADLKTSLQDAAKVGANSVILDWQIVLSGGRTGSQVEPRFPLDRLVEEIVVARELGFHVSVKPVLMVGGDNNPNKTHWHDIEPEDPDKWFATYTAQLESLIERPESKSIDAILLGNELHSMTSPVEHKPRWEKMIATVRSNFPGQIGYNAKGLIGPWKTSQEYRQLPFIDSLDFIGISAYPRLSRKLDATAEDYRAGWSKSPYGENIAQQLADFIASQEKDVYLTELGSPANSGGIEFRSRKDLGYDLKQQAAFYDVSLDVLAGVKNLKGVYIYNWHANAGKKLGFEPEFNPNAFIWNIYGKPAQQSIRRRFLK